MGTRGLNGIDGVLLYVTLTLVVVNKIERVRYVLRHNYSNLSF